MTEKADEAHSIVFTKSNADMSKYPIVNGFDFNQFEEKGYEGLMDAFATMGFQGTHFSRACDVVNGMLNFSMADEDNDGADVRCKIYLAFTANQVSCGNREVIRWLCEHKLVDVVITSAGAVEEDLIKCLEPSRIGDFTMDGRELRSQGVNRIGNTLVPNQAYCKFEDWVVPLLDEMLAAQHESGEIWTPSKMIRFFGERIEDPASFEYWCARNGIPVFCPALTDGSLGDMIYFHSYKHEKPLIVDIAGDIRALNDTSVFAKKTGQIILGGGTPKHHCNNCQLQRNGADFSVYVNTAMEFDGSDSGASPDEAVSWGKIRGDAKPVKVTADATLVFPLLVAQTFLKFHQRVKKEAGGQRKD